MTRQPCTRAPTVAVVALSAIVTLSACTQALVDHDQIAQRQEGQDAKNDTDAGLIASLASQATAGHDDARVQTSFQSPVPPTAITFTCFGDAALDPQVDSSSSSGTTTTTIGSIECADSHVS
jgi:hypothetical protein